MYKNVFLEERVSLTPDDISKKENTTDIVSLLASRLKGRIEGKCIAAGYVKQDSLEILNRSMGTAENGRFTGNYIFYVKLRCKVFHPETTVPVECRVIKVNKMGAYVVFDEAMRVLLPRDLHIGNTVFDSLNPDDTVTIQVLRSRFQTNDPFISSVGLFISRSAVGTGVVRPAIGGAVDISAEDM
jgi:DNA-directed RNA polymerase subunit E'/Rpb7